MRNTYLPKGFYGTQDQASENLVALFILAYKYDPNLKMGKSALAATSKAIDELRKTNPKVWCQKSRDAMISSAINMINWGVTTQEKILNGSTWLHHRNQNVAKKSKQIAYNLFGDNFNNQSKEVLLPEKSALYAKNNNKMADLISKYAKFGTFQKYRTFEHVRIYRRFEHKKMETIHEYYVNGVKVVCVIKYKTGYMTILGVGMVPNNDTYIQNKGYYRLRDNKGGKGYPGSSDFSYFEENMFNVLMLDLLRIKE